MGIVLGTAGIIEGIEALTAGEIISSAAGATATAIGADAGISAGIVEGIGGALEGVTGEEILAAAGETLVEEEAVLSPFEEEAFIDELNNQELVPGPAMSEELFNTAFEELENELSEIGEKLGLDNIKTLLDKVKDNLTLSLFKKVLQRIVEGAISVAAGEELLKIITGGDNETPIFVIDDNGKLIPQKLSPPQLARKIMQTISYVANGATVYNKESEDEVIKEVEKSFETLNFTDKIFANKLWQFLKQTPVFKTHHLEKFNEIYKIYDGKNLQFWEKFNKTQNRMNYFVKNELGETQVYYKPPNPNSTTTFWGTYGGPHSYNNSLPKDTLDSFYMCHDISYQDAFLNLEGDLQLISRILHNIDQLNFKAKAAALMTVSWFSTAGVSLASLTGRTNAVSAGDIKNIKNDIFSNMTNNSDIGKEEFYETLAEEYKDSFLDFALNSGIAFDEQQLEETRNYNQGLLRFFDNLEIELI